MYWDTCLSVERFVYEWQGGKFCLYGHCMGFKRVHSYGTSHLTYFWAIKQSNIQFKLRWALFVKYTIITRSEMCSFNPSKWRSGQPTVQRPGSSWGFGALLKGLTSVVDTSCQSWDSNPQPWVTSGFKSNALSSFRPRLAPVISDGCLGIWAF